MEINEPVTIPCHLKSTINEKDEEEEFDDNNLQEEQWNTGKLSKMTKEELRLALKRRGILYVSTKNWTNARLKAHLKQL